MKIETQQLVVEAGFMFAYKPDYQACMERYRAFWHQAVIDRPLISFSYPKKHQQNAIMKPYKNHRERWLDFDTRIANEIIRLENTQFCLDAMPVAWPNMGPEIISAMCGCPYHFGKDTAWSEPCIHDWQTDDHKAVFDWENSYFRMLETYMKRLIQQGKNRFIVGHTDMHPGADHLACLVVGSRKI